MNISVLSYAQDKDVVVVGAGVAGLVAALELSHLGYRVRVYEAAAGPGGKMRQIPSNAGFVDIGPTVLTLVSIFRDLFTDVGENLDDYITLVRQKILARHWWPDGSTLDLFDCHQTNLDSIQEFSGSKSRREYARFYENSRALFDAFDVPMMRNPAPSLAEMNRVVLKNPALIGKMHPFQTLEQYLARQFSDPRLQQLFGRYATYVGGTPLDAPALLALIWQAEARGVWAIKGGMGQLARALEQMAIARGATFHYNSPVAQIDIKNDCAQGVTLETGEYIAADFVVFNGDPRALVQGSLGAKAKSSLPARHDQAKRSLSAFVWGFCGKYSGPDLIHHNVFFADKPNSEFYDIAKGLFPQDPTLYICAQDRGKNAAYPEQERFEVIVNAPPASQLLPKQEDFETCTTKILDRLNVFGAQLDADLGPQNFQSPSTFNTRFPGSDGSLYGISPSGMMAALRRPKTRTGINNLYLIGGGIHPGAGVPMVTLCARQAVEAITADQISTLKSRKMGMPGGTSMA